jgi:hypothetical protein
VIAHEGDLGGSVAEVAVAGKCGVAIVADPVVNVNHTSLVSFDPDTGQTRAVLVAPTPGFDLSGLAWTMGKSVLVVGDRRAGGGGGYPVHVFDLTGDCDLAERPDAVFLPQKPTGFRALK